MGEMAMGLRAANDFDKVMDKEYHYFLGLKRLYLLQVKVLEACDGRPIKNDLLYHQLLFAGFDGLVVRLVNFQKRLGDFLSTLKNDHLDHFKMSNRKGLEVDPRMINCVNGPDPEGQKQEAEILTRMHQQHFDQVYDRVFPDVRARGNGRPRHEDFDRLAEQLRTALAKIKAHRDTVVAHWDEQQEEATVVDLKAAIEHIENLLKDLFYISKLSSVSFELGGVAADVKRTAKELAELILGSHRPRLAKPTDMDAVYMMGFDVWSAGASKDDYLAACRTSEKYAKGTWYVLEDADGTPVSALITYKFDPVNGKPAIGIGSITTVPAQRKHGHASQLLWDVMGKFHARDGSQVFFLHADVDPKFYEKRDFVRLPDKYQTRAGSTVMIRCPKELREILLANPEFTAPGYF